MHRVVEIGPTHQRVLKYLRVMIAFGLHSRMEIVKMKGGVGVVDIGGRKKIMMMMMRERSSATPTASTTVASSVPNTNTHTHT